MLLFMRGFTEYLNLTNGVSLQPYTYILIITLWGTKEFENKLRVRSYCERHSGKKIARRRYKTRVHIKQRINTKIRCNMLGMLLVNGMSIVQKIICHYQRQIGNEVL